MATEGMCWGIELGSGAIKALKLGLKSDGSVEVLDFAIIPHKKVMSTPDLDQDDAMRVAIGQLVSQYDLSGVPIAISIPGHQSFARFAKLPPVEPKKVPDIVKFEAVQQIPFPLEEVEWDYQTFASPDSPEIEVGIFAITKQRIERELGLLRDVGLSPDTVTIAPVATYNAMAYDLQFTEKTPGTVILDVGTTSTDLIIADSGRVWIRTFPIGGHHFTEALVERFKLSYAKAERLKREAERSKHSRHIFQAMRGVFSDLAQETQRSIGYHHSLHPEAELKRLIGVGATFRLPGLRRFLKQQLQLDVYRMDDFKRLSLDNPRAGEFGAATLEMSVAYGLAIQGLGLQTIDANLMPVAIMRDGMWGRKTKWFGIAAGLSVVASAAMFISWAIDKNAVKTTQLPNKIQDVVRVANRLKNEASSAGVTGAVATDAEAQQLLALPNGRELVAFVMQDLGQLMAWTNAQVPVWQSTHGNGPEQAFKLISYTMQYSKAGAGGDDGGGGRSSRSARNADPIDVGPYSDKPKILVTLEIETYQPDPRPFLLNTILPWLEANKDRDGVPYVILDTEQLHYDQLAAGGDRQVDRRSASTRFPGRNARDRNEFGGGGGGGEFFDETGGGGEIGMSDEERRRMARGTGGGRTSFGQPAITGSVDELAPLPVPEEQDFGRDPSRYLVRWTLAIVPPEDRIRPDEPSAEDNDGGEG